MCWAGGGRKSPSATAHPLNGLIGWGRVGLGGRLIRINPDPDHRKMALRMPMHDPVKKTQKQREEEEVGGVGREEWLMRVQISRKEIWPTAKMFVYLLATAED